MKKLVVFSGAGMSAESGLATFRDQGGLWDKYDINEVATPEAWQRNPALVLDFYNQRRRQILEASPNAAHVALAKLEAKYDTTIITQNIDDLHERAGSTKVLHLHGEVFKAKTSEFSEEFIEIKENLKLGDLGDDGLQLRPHVVWFGESVPEFDRASQLVKKADIVIVVGTSLNVYPAAGLIYHVREESKMYVVDPKITLPEFFSRHTLLHENASSGVPNLVKQLLRA